MQEGNTAAAFQEAVFNRLALLGESIGSRKIIARLN